MSFKRKQFTAIIILISTFTFASGLCYGAVASAEVVDVVPIQTQMLEMQDCSEPTPAPVQVEKSIPVGDSVMPCCLDRHDNTPTTAGTILKDRTNFADVGEVDFSAQTLSLLQKYTYISSPGPPPKPDKNSSIFRLE